MKKNKTEIVLVVDRSGSMDLIKQDMEGGFKTYIESQKQLDGECFITYYQFDNKIEKVFENRDISEVDSITIDPRASTSLIDAIGTSIQEVGQRLNSTDTNEKPEHVIFVIITDGQENASQEYKAHQVRDMVKHQEEKYNWKFNFLGANIDAVEVGNTYGFNRNTTMTYAGTKSGINRSFSTLCSASTANRAGLDYTISEEERKEAVSK